MIETRTAPPSLLRGVFTIPTTAPFLPTLAAGIMARVAAGAHDLTSWRILLPTRRAGRELRGAFLDLAQNRPILLPRLQSIGDVDAEELDLYMAGFGFTNPDIPPAIPPLERLFLLAELTRKKDPTLTIDQSLVLARGLARLIDQVHTEDLGFEKLGDIVPDALSEHWQSTLQFLEIVTALWPAILAERGMIDPADRRNRLMKSLIAFWREHPPTTPVLAAGSTGSIPTTANLLTTIAHLPQGMVVLPGLDTEIDISLWDAITDTHPQATMQHLLGVMGYDKNTVRLWHGEKDAPESQQAARRDVIRAMMAPPSMFQAQPDLPIQKGLENVTIIEAKNPQDEAAAIAIALRDVLEQPHKTACFVTPDRILARRVMTALSRWGIDVDDSAGGALAVMPSATFLGSILRTVQDDFTPLPLLDFLKHPLRIAQDIAQITLFEKEVLRGPRPAAGLVGWERRKESVHGTEAFGAADHVLQILTSVFAPFASLTTGEHPVPDFCHALIGAAEMAGGGAAVFWAYPESEALADFLANVMDTSVHLPPLTLSLFCDVFHELLSTESFRETDPRHRRILFLGQLESRLVRRDVMILGGLNEGTWPTDPGYDPWLSRPMRRDFGLPTVDKTVGLAAHDFASHLSASEVIVTRSMKMDGTATVPARWLQRLKALMNGAGESVDWATHHYLSWAGAMDAPQRPFVQINTPAPCPPRDARPQKLSATAIEKWMNNPYRIYAERILKLRPLKAIEEDVTHAERGSFVHDILNDFVGLYPGELPTDARNILLDMGRTRFAALESLAPHWHYWWPRFERIVDWFLENEQLWRKEAIPWKREEEAGYCLYQSPNSGRSFTITAKADRIDRLKIGGAYIIDYKTGTPPSWIKVANGLAPQLPIEALIAARGGWGNTEAIAGFAYWKISGGLGGSSGRAGEVKSSKFPIDEVIAAAEEGLRNLVVKFEDAHTPYLALPLTGRLYEDDKAYDHLARTAEWASDNASDDGDDDAASGEGEAA